MPPLLLRSAAGAAVTRARQLELAPLPPAPDYGRPLLAVGILGKPVRAKHACTCHGEHPGTRPLPDWKDWRRYAIDVLREHWGRRPTLVCPVVVQVVAVFQRSRRPRKTFDLKGETHPYPYPWTSGRVPYVGRPDFDQVWKAAVDVCVHAEILRDDPLVVRDAGSDRVYAAEGEEPCVEVRLWRA